MKPRKSWACNCLLAAKTCREDSQNGGESAFHSPSLFLTAHALELTLKAISLWAGNCECQLRDDGHKLLGPFNRAKSTVKSRAIIECAETCVRNEWKSKLRNDRLEYHARFDGFLEVDSPSNSDIGQQLPTLLQAVAWMDPLHAPDGGAFRYVQINQFYSVPVVNCFGKTTFIVPKTLAWACHSILDSLEGELRRKSKIPQLSAASVR